MSLYAASGASSALSVRHSCAEFVEISRREVGRTGFTLISTRITSTEPTRTTAVHVLSRLLGWASPPGGLTKHVQQGSAEAKQR